MCLTVLCLRTVVSEALKLRFENSVFEVIIELAREAAESHEWAKEMWKVTFSPDEFFKGL